MPNLFINLYLFLLYFSGFFDRREFIVTQHPLERTICDFWRMVWEQESRLIVTLSSIDSQECRPFWPAIIGEMLSWETNKRGDQMRLTLLEEADTLARRAIRLNLELVSPPYYYYYRLTQRCVLKKISISPVLGICWLFHVLKKTRDKFVKLTLATKQLITFRLYFSPFKFWI